MCVYNAKNKTNKKIEEILKIESVVEVVRA